MVWWLKLLKLGLNLASAMQSRFPAEMVATWRNLKRDKIWISFQARDWSDELNPFLSLVKRKLTLLFSTWLSHLREKMLRFVSIQFGAGLFGPDCDNHIVGICQVVWSPCYKIFFIYWSFGQWWRFCNGLVFFDSVSVHAFFITVVFLVIVEFILFHSKWMLF